ncbi:MAG: hypothetical protein JW808_06250 [Victivallales bacterium]|nr:hypothetical protein [Victivallales bacterium]
MARRRKSGCLYFFVVGGLVVILGCAGIYIYEQHRKTRVKIDSLVAGLPGFDEDAAVIEAAREMGIEYPIAPPVLDEDQIRDKTREDLESIADERFPRTVLAEQTNAIIEKFRVRKEGESVSFQLKTTGQDISGTYGGLLTDWKGRFVVVDGQRYRTHDIDPQSHYFFDSIISQSRATKDILKTRKEFEGKRREIMISNKDAVLDSVYAASGYSRKGGVWKSNVQAHAELVEEKRRQHDRDTENCIEKIYDENRLLGLIRLGIPERSSDDDWAGKD